MAKAEPNYTEEMVAAITSAYQAETPVEEIADMTAWVASPRCSFTTGQVFDVTGGRATY